VTCTRTDPHDAHVEWAAKGTRFCPGVVDDDWDRAEWQSELEQDRQRLYGND